MDLVQFKILLDQEYKWPAYYLFKFILPVHEVDSLKKLYSSVSWQEKPSKQGNYMSLSANVFCHSSEEVLHIYRSAITIKGIIAL